MSEVVLTTARLVLRPHTIADVDECTAMWGDAEVTRYIGGKPSTPEEVWARVCRYAGQWRLLGFGYFAAREKSSGRFVGDVGLADFRRDITPSLAGSPELGYALAAWAHGNGYATEAAQAVLAWADARSEPLFARTVCIIDPPNVASARVAEKLGYREAFRATYHGEPALVFERRVPVRA